MSQEVRDAMVRLKTELQSYTYTTLVNHEELSTSVHDSVSSKAEINDDRTVEEMKESPVKTLLQVKTDDGDLLQDRLHCPEYRGLHLKLTAKPFPQDKEHGNSLPEVTCLRDNMGSSNNEVENSVKREPQSEKSEPKDTLFLPHAVNVQLESVHFSIAATVNGALDSTEFHRKLNNENILAGCEGTAKVECSCAVVCSEAAKTEPTVEDTNLTRDMESDEKYVNSITYGTALSLKEDHRVVSSNAALHERNGPLPTSDLCCTCGKMESCDREKEDSCNMKNDSANLSAIHIQQGSTRDCYVKLERLPPDVVMTFSSILVTKSARSDVQISPKAKCSSSEKFKNKSWGQKMVECKVCCETVKKRNMSTHLQQHNGVCNKRLCHVCGRMLKPDSLSDHLKRHSGTLPRNFECKYCGETFSRPYVTRQHERTHTLERPFQCTKCPKRFAQKCAYLGHIRLHSGEKLHECNICQKRFAQKSNLNAHLLRHSGNRPYACNVCDKRFYESSQLTKHMRTHTGVKPYSCEFCGKFFAHSGYLITHKRIHTGEKPFKCDKCDASFPYAGSLKSHKARHAGYKRHTIKRYQCKECGKKFSGSNDLENHFSKHTGVKRHACEVCNSKFTTAASLTEHIRKGRCAE